MPPDSALNQAGDLAERYGILSLQPLLRTCRGLVHEDVIRVAVLGRFKAGKSSFLNDLAGENFLPAGVIPITAAVTEVAYGEKRCAQVQFIDGRTEVVTIEAIPDFVSEGRNPENKKSVQTVRVRMPSLERFRNIVFVDTPGLGSAFEHNTEVSLSWLPNAGLALIAIGVDTPLSAWDLALLRDVYRYTPHVNVLLTKVDALSERERAEVAEFVEAQLRRHFDPAPPVFLYSIRPGYEHLKERLQKELLLPAQGEFKATHAGILSRKIETLLDQCEDYLTLALKSAETLDCERKGLRAAAIVERSALEEAKTQLRLIARHAAGGTRQTIEEQLAPFEQELETRLTSELETAYDGWARSIGSVIRAFRDWLDLALKRELSAISSASRSLFSARVARLKDQLVRSVQDFQRRLSDRTAQAFGVTLRIAEIEIDVVEPRTPDIRIGHVFDHNWELLGAAIPMLLVRRAIKSHLVRKTVPDEVFKNLSRLSSQWEESVTQAMTAVEKQAEQRLDELVDTVDALLSRTSLEAPRIRADLRRIASARENLRS